MSKVDKKWEDFSEWEKQKAYDELSSLIRVKQQKERVNETPVKVRLEEIKRKFIRGRI
ncbi:MAG: hypothetical protein ACFFDF_12935 [Candidatus Odinarchaeota archaeon]